MNAGTLYKEAAVHSASTVGLVLTMYDMLIADMTRAITALRAGDIEDRTAEVKHALDVLMHLQSALNFEEGGNAANSLDTFYAIVRGKLLQAHIQQSVSLFEQQIELVSGVREAWREAQRREQPAASSNATMPPPSPGAESFHIANWRA